MRGRQAPRTAFGPRADVLQCLSVSKTQIRGPQKQGSHVLDTEIARLVVDSYSRNTTEDAKRDGQAAAAAILPLRRRLWALAERLVPERLAAALRARGEPGDPTGRDGVRELRLAVADWLDPPPACRWCRRPMRPGEEARECETAGRRMGRPARPERKSSEVVIDEDGGRHVQEQVVRAARRAWTPRSVECRPSKVRRAAGAVERCGTLALYSAGAVDLVTMAAALRTKVGQATGYDVAADRDLRALLAACAPEAPRDVARPELWADDGAWRLHAAVVDADTRARRPGVPAPVLAALAPVMAARDRNLRTNGRTGIAVQLRYHSPRDGVTRADLTQGAMIGLDRGSLDYDASQARFTTYAAAWSRQGCGEAWSRRDLVGVPPWILDLRRAICERLHLNGPGSARDLLAAVKDLSATAGAASAALASHHLRCVNVNLDETALTKAPVADGELDLALIVPPSDKAVRSKDPGHTGNRDGVVVVGGGELVGALHGFEGTPCERTRQDSLSLFTSLIYAQARALVGLLAVAEVTDLVPGSRPARRIRRRLLAGRELDALVREAVRIAMPPPGPSPLRRLMRSALGSRPRPPWRSKGRAAQAPVREDPEAARERIAAWVAVLLGLKASGSGLLAALRHGAPVFVGVGSGGDDDEDAQGTDGAGGAERAAAVLAAPDDFAEAEDEQEDAARWGRALSALAVLRASGDGDVRGPEMAEVVRRHHGLDSIAEGTQGAGGESFQSIGETGLACSGRRLAKESVRKIYGRALDVLRRMAAGEAADLGESVEDEPDAPVTAASPAAVSSALATFNHRRAVVQPPSAPAVRDPAWESFREAADGIAW